MFLEVRQRRPPQRPHAQYHYRYTQSSLSLDDGSDNKERYPSSPSGLFETVWMAMTTTSWDRKGRRKRMLLKYRTYLFLMLVVCYATTRSFLAPWYRRQPKDLLFLGRQRTLNRLVITLRYNHHTIHMPRPSEVLQESSINPDYDGLSLNWLEDFDLGRNIASSDESDYETVHGALLDTMSKYFVESQYYHDDEQENEKDGCRRNNWQRKLSPNCNDLHITALERPLDGLDGKEEQGVDIKFLGQGYFRAVWLVKSPVLGTSVLKRIHLNKHFPLNHIDYYKVHRDAIIMEQLTSSPRIVDIYGHCGFSILSEAMKGEITSELMYKTGFIKPGELHDADAVRPMNNYTVDQKLQIALEMAESIADLHGYEGGLILHGDVHPVQWLWSADGILKLNDFNNAEIMDWNGKDYCKRYRVYGGMYRAPEEFRGSIVDEKMDVFSMGNNIYVLLTGLFPFYYLNSYEEIQKKVINGTRPFVDERYRNRSFGERSMIQIMEKCWDYDPKKRPEIFDVVRFLRKTIEENNRSSEIL